MRHPEHDHFSIAEMLELEQHHMMPMPEPFDGYVEHVARVSSTCLVAVHRNRYSVPCELAGQLVSTRLYPEQALVSAHDAVVAEHLRAFDRGQTVYDWRHYIALAQRNPGVPIADMPAALLRFERIDASPGRGPCDGASAGRSAGGRARCGPGGRGTGAGKRRHGRHGERRARVNIVARLTAAPAPEYVETTLMLSEPPRADTDGRGSGPRSSGTAPNARRDRPSQR
jgi:hypothetical protein